MLFFKCGNEYRKQRDRELFNERKKRVSVVRGRSGTVTDKEWTREF